MGKVPTQDPKVCEIQWDRRRDINREKYTLKTQMETKLLIRAKNFKADLLNFGTMIDKRLFAELQMEITRKLNNGTHRTRAKLVRASTLEARQATIFLVGFQIIVAILKPFAGILFLLFYC